MIREDKAISRELDAVLGRRVRAGLDTFRRLARNCRCTGRDLARLEQLAARLQVPTRELERALDKVCE